MKVIGGVFRRGENVDEEEKEKKKKRRRRRRRRCEKAWLADSGTYFALRVLKNALVIRSTVSTRVHAAWRY